MNVRVLIFVGGVAGWLTGNAVEMDGRTRVARETHVLHAIHGIIAAMVGEYLLFWMVIDKGDAFSDEAVLERTTQA